MPYEHRVRDADAAGIAFHVHNLDLALRALDTASTDCTAATRRRNRKRASDAYQAVWLYLEKVTPPTAAQEAELQPRLALLKQRLETEIG